MLTPFEEEEEVAEFLFFKNSILISFYGRGPFPSSHWHRLRVPIPVFQRDGEGSKRNFDRIVSTLVSKHFEYLVSIVGNSFNCSLGAMAGNTETLVRHCLVGAHAAGCAQAEPQTATDSAGSNRHMMIIIFMMHIISDDHYFGSSTNEEVKNIG